MRASRLAFALSMIVSGCAFKEPEAELPPKKEAMEVGLSWGESGEVPGPAQPRFLRSAEREGGEFRFVALKSVSLPAVVPSSIAMTGKLPSGVAPEFLRAFIQLESTRIELPAQIRVHEGRYEARVVGTNIAFAQDRAQSGRLELAFYSRQERQMVLDLPLRTPPSRVAVRSMSLPELAQDSDILVRGFRFVAFEGRRFHLLRALHVKNAENTSVEVRIPRALAASFAQLTTAALHRDLGCSGEGYVVDRRPEWRSLSRMVWVLPLDGDLVRELGVSLRAKETEERISSQFEPGESRYFGLFAEGEGADEWAAKGALTSELSTIRVPSSCYDECVERFCSCGRYCKELELKACSCIQKETRRHTAEITVGIYREPPVLRFQDSVPNLVLRFGDLDSHIDPEDRTIPGFQPVSPVEWIQ